MRAFPIAMLVAFAAAGCNDAKRTGTNATPADQRTSAAVHRDNTAVNERDRGTAAKTPLDQNENKTDINITANIRKQVVDTKMSVDAQNVKIITQDGKVTLRGPVKSADEKKQIEDIAYAVAGNGNVDSQLELEQ